MIAVTSREYANAKIKKFHVGLGVDPHPSGSVALARARLQLLFCEWTKLLPLGVMGQVGLWHSTR